MTDRQYQLSALLRSSGLGVVFSDASGLVKTTGKLHGDNLEPVSLHYSWTGEDSINFARLDYADGAPVSYETNYKSERSQKAVVPISMENVGSGTRDPFLSLLVRQGPEKGDAFCRTPMREPFMTGAALPGLTRKIWKARHLLPRRATLPAACAGSQLPDIRRKPTNAPKTCKSAVNLEFAGTANSGFMAPREVSVSTRYGTVRIVAVEPFHESNMQVVPTKLELPPRIDDDEDEDWCRMN